jgi:hypothetical protein
VIQHQRLPCRQLDMPAMLGRPRGQHRGYEYPGEACRR